MGSIETEAIILRSYKLSEADKIVVCLTRKTGLLRGVARGARRLKSKFGAGLEPLTVVHLDYYEKEGRELVTLKQLDILKSYFHLSGQAGAVKTLSYLCELALEFAPPHEPNEKLYRMVKACAEAVDLNPAQAEQIARYFEVWMLKLSGLWIDLRSCSQCHEALTGLEDVYLNAEHRVRCKSCAQGMGDRITGSAQQSLRAIQRLPPQEFAGRFKEQPDEVWSQLKEMTQDLIARHLERVPRSRKAFGE